MCLTLYFKDIRKCINRPGLELFFVIVLPDCTDKFHVEQLHVLRRLSNTLAIHTKLMLLGVILSSFTFGSTMWHFCNMSDSRKLQEKAGPTFGIHRLFRAMQNCDKEQMYLFLCINRIRNEMTDVFKIVSQGNSLHRNFIPFQQWDFSVV